MTLSHLTSTTHPCQFLKLDDEGCLIISPQSQGNQSLRQSPLAQQCWDVVWNHPQPQRVQKYIRALLSLNASLSHLHFVDGEKIKWAGNQLCFFFKHRLQCPGLFCCGFTQQGRGLTKGHVSEVLVSREQKIEQVHRIKDSHGLSKIYASCQVFHGSNFECTCR